MAKMGRGVLGGIEWAIMSGTHNCCSGVQMTWVQSIWIDGEAPPTSPYIRDESAGNSSAVLVPIVPVLGSTPVLITEETVDVHGPEIDLFGAGNWGDG